MPTLDVSEILLDPEIASVITVKRIAETVSNRGRSVQTPTTIPDVIGVVTAASPNDLLRLDDSERMDRHISIVTRFRLQGPSPGRQPDKVIWCGDLFVIKSIEPYPQYGFGFVQAIAGSVDHQDQPPYSHPNQPSQMDFTSLGNSGQIGAL